MTGRVARGRAPVVVAVAVAMLLSLVVVARAATGSTVAAPVITSTGVVAGPDPATQATVTVTWIDPQPGVTYECSIENGAFAPCVSPDSVVYTITTTNNGVHQFAVRAVDAAGNVSTATTFSFKYPDGLPFNVTGNPAPLGIGVWQPVPLTVSNPNTVAIAVQSLSLTLYTTSTACPVAQNIDVRQSTISATAPLQVPAQGSVSLAADDPRVPAILLIDRPDVNQDACKGVTFTLAFSGSAPTL